MDYCYIWNNSSIKQQLIDLIRQKGGKERGNYKISDILTLLTQRTYSTPTIQTTTPTTPHNTTHEFHVVVLLVFTLL